MAKSSQTGAMLRAKLTVTALWSAALIACVMVADYAISILLLHDPAGYTPFVTLAISTLVTFPSTYMFINVHYNLRAVSEELAQARDAANQAREATLAALTVTDIARRAAERDHKAAVDANNSKSQFLANMSHELRTPLNAILGYSELLSIDTFANRRAEYAELIHKSGAHLLGLIDDLLDLAKIEAGHAQVGEEAVDLRAVIEECLALVRPRADNGQVTLVHTIAPALPSVRGNARALKQIVLNLLSNAIKFTPPHGKVGAFAHPDRNGDLVFGVRDNGIGIAAEDHARVFERFGQARHDVTIAEKGTGLGLPIVKGLVEALQGRITLESELGSGTCVTIWIPRKRLQQLPGLDLAPARAS